MNARTKKPIHTVEQLENVLSRPGEDLIDQVSTWDDGVMVLGAGGKMGPTLCRMAKNALDEAGKNLDVIAVSRFTNEEEKVKLEAAGVKTISADLMDPTALANLPQVKHIVFAAGHKFGSAGAESLTWAMNAYLPGMVASTFKHSHIAVFSSGNVYPLVSPAGGGCTEQTPPDPIGEYAQSVLGRERIFEHFSRTNGTPMTLIRLNYAVELRYGVIVDIAQTIAAGEPVDLTMGHVNVLWQRDANEYALRSLSIVDSPPAILNVTGPETVSVEWAARELARAMDTEAVLRGEPAPEALLNNASTCFAHFGYPKTTLSEMIDLVADWVKRDGETHGKPTGFQVRDGRF